MQTPKPITLTQGLTFNNGELADKWYNCRFTFI